MKKMIALFLGLACVFSLVGCNQLKQQPVDSQTKNEIKGEAGHEAEGQTKQEPDSEAEGQTKQESDSEAESQTKQEPDSEAEGQTDTESEQNTEFEGTGTNISIKEFSYAENCERYTDDWGVKTSGFVNTTEVDINVDNVVEVAKNECTIKWNTFSIYFDASANVWMVLFFTEYLNEDGEVEFVVVGGGQSVYMDNKGRTLLIVYGE